jgi:clan AA aspartic protease
MTGRVENLHALVPITFRLLGQPDLNIEFVVDTGFTEELTLPPAAVIALGLPFTNELVITLANDSEDTVAVHTATIVWDGEEREVRVFATGRRPLLGTALLAGSELVAQFIQGGLVTIDSILPV